MTANNYARNVITREYVFLAAGDRPRPEWLNTTWIWYRIPDDTPKGEQVLLIGESQGNRISRLKRGQE